MDGEKKDENDENVRKKKRNTRNTLQMSYYGPIEKKLSITQTKIQKMITTVEDELKRVDIEWMHLKGMMAQVEPVTKVVKTEPEMNMDDARQINESKCDLDISANTNEENMFSSESESSDHGFSDMEDYNTENIFI